MTHSLHRFGRPAMDLKDDYIIFMMAEQGINDIGSLEKRDKFSRAAFKYDPVNVPRFRPEKNLNIFRLYVRGRRETVPAKQLLEEGRVRQLGKGVGMIVFDNKQALEEFLKEVKEMDLGLSVNVSSLIDDVIEMAPRTSVWPHSINYALGFRGNLYNLPDQQVLALTTMCGHGLISSNFAKKMVDMVKERRLTPEKAAGYMAKFCVCGAFNTSRATRILRVTKMAKLNT